MLHFARDARCFAFCVQFLDLCVKFGKKEAKFGKCVKAAEKNDNVAASAHNSTNTD